MMATAPLPFDHRDMVRSSEVVVGTRHLDADALDRPTALALADLTPGTLSTFLIAHGAIRWDVHGEIATPDYFGTLAPTGTVMDVYDVHDSRIVGASPVQRPRSR